MPDDTTLIRCANLIQPETLHRLLDHVVPLAQRLKVTRDRKLRTDGTVVETNIYYPTDSSLLADGVRVLSRARRSARRVMDATASQSGQVAKGQFRNRWQRAQRGPSHRRCDSSRHERDRQPVQFGHKVWLDEVEGSIASDYRVLDGNLSDDHEFPTSLDRHKAIFGRPPEQVSGDRGLYSPGNETLAKDMGVRRVILAKPGYRSTERKEHEHQPWFRRGRHYHAGVEGRISVLKRHYGLDRRRNHGEDGFERWVGWGLVAHNLWTMHLM